MIYSIRQALIVALMAACFIHGGPRAMAADIPDYSVERELTKDIELRQYPASLIAKVTVTGERNAAASAAFRLLAGFIFGGNERREKIAMTAPVTQIPQNMSDDGEMSWTVDFRMPSHYDRSTLPVPEDGSIVIEDVAPYSAVAIRFNGGGSVKNLQTHRHELDTALHDYPDIKTEGPPIYAFYNAPFVPSFMRRNEVMYRVVQD